MAPMMDFVSEDSLYPNLCRFLAGKGYRPKSAREVWSPREQNIDYIQKVIITALLVDMPQSRSYDFQIPSCTGTKVGLQKLFHTEDRRCENQTYDPEIGKILWNAPKLIEPFLVCLMLSLAKNKTDLEEFCAQYTNEKKPGLYKLVVDHLAKNDMCPFSPDILKIDASDTRAWEGRSSLDNAFRTAYVARNDGSHIKLEPDDMSEAIDAGQCTIAVIFAFVEHNIEAIRSKFRCSSPWDSSLKNLAEKNIRRTAFKKAAHVYKENMLGGLLALPHSDLGDEDYSDSEQQENTDTKFTQLSWCNLNEILTKTDMIVVTGPGGSGKTTFLQYIAWEGASRYDTICDAFLPVYVSLARYSREIMEFGLTKTLGEILCLESGWLQQFFRDAPCLFIFDGLNEVPTGRRKQVEEELCKLLDKDGSPKVIVSSRHDSTLPTNDVAYAIVAMEPFDLKSARRFVEAECRVLGEDSQATGRIWEAIKVRFACVHNLRYPFMLKVMVQVLSGVQCVNLVSQATIYREYVAQLLKREFGEKQRVPPEEIPSTICQHVDKMSAFALSMVDAQVLEFKPTGDLETKLWKETVDAGLAEYVPEHTGACSFLHEDIRDYFASEALTRDIGIWARLLGHWSMADDESVPIFISDHITPLRFAVEIAENPSQILMSEQVNNLPAEWREYLFDECQDDIRIIEALAKFVKRIAQDFDKLNPFTKEPELRVLRSAVRALAKFSSKSSDAFAVMRYLTSGNTNQRISIIALQACRYTSPTVAQNLLLDMVPGDSPESLHTRLEILLIHFPDNTSLHEVLNPLTDEDLLRLAESQKGKQDAITNINRVFSALEESRLRPLIGILCELLPKTTLRAAHLPIDHNFAIDLRVFLCSQLISSHGFSAAIRAAQHLNLSDDDLSATDWRFKYFFAHVPCYPEIKDFGKEINEDILLLENLPFSVREGLVKFNRRLFGIVGAEGDTIEIRGLPFVFNVTQNWKRLRGYSLVWFTPSEIWTDPNKARMIPEKKLNLITETEPPCKNVSEYANGKTSVPCISDNSEISVPIRCSLCDNLEGTVKPIDLDLYRKFSFISIIGGEDIFVHDSDCMYPLNTLFGQRVTFTLCRSYDRNKKQETLKAILVQPIGPEFPPSGVRGLKPNK